MTCIIEVRRCIPRRTADHLRIPLLFPRSGYSHYSYTREGGGTDVHAAHRIAERAVNSVATSLLLRAWPHWSVCVFGLRCCTVQTAAIILDIFYGAAMAKSGTSREPLHMLLLTAALAALFVGYLLGRIS